MAINFKKWWDNLGKKPTPPPQPVPPQTRIVAAIVRPTGVQGTLRTDSGHSYTTTATEAAPDKFNLAFTIPVTETGGATLDLALEEHGSWSGRVNLDPVLGTNFELWAKSKDVDPSGIPLREIARIRGAMWTVPGKNWPLLPSRFERAPNAPNVTSLGDLAAYAPHDQLDMINHYKSFGYTHAVQGPPGGPGGGYRNWWPREADFSGEEGFDRFLDQLQLLWNNGLTPIVFLHYDGQNFQQTVANWDHLIRGNARAQRLIRIIVPSGWEPAQYQWSNATWTQYAKWAREILPNALVLIHTTSDVHAPVGGPDEFGNDDGKDNAIGWRNIAPYIHGWLFQSSTFEDRNTTGCDRRYPNWTKFDCWRHYFDVNDPPSLVNRFRTGYAGWPTNSAWTDGGGILVYAAEYCSYWVLRNEKGGTYEEGVQWGNAAMEMGAAGYLDGGSVDVPRSK